MPLQYFCSRLDYRFVKKNLEEDPMRRAPRETLGTSRLEALEALFFFQNFFFRHLQSVTVWSNYLYIIIYVNIPTAGIYTYIYQVSHILIM